MNTDSLHSINISVESLELESSEGALRYEPFKFELSDRAPNCCVIGASGSGKTTFFKSLMHRFILDWQEYESVSARIHITRNGLNFYKTNGRIGYAAQRPFFIAHRSVRENLILPFHWCRGPVPSEQRVSEVINDFHLSTFLDRKAYQLSGGERQRLNLARMFIADPEIAIIDECYSALDEDLVDSISKVIVNKYAHYSRVLIAAHRINDLRYYLPAVLSFTYNDIYDNRRVRKVQVRYEYDEKEA